MNRTESTRPGEISADRKQDQRCLTAAKLARIIGWVIAGIVLACFFALIFGLLVKWLWGVTLTPLFNVPQPSYWQAVGLILLGKLLFGGFGHPRKDPNHSFRHKVLHDRFHGYPGKKCSSPDPKEPSDVEQGKDCREFWEREGKKAFADYLERGRSLPENQQK